MPVLSGKTIEQSLIVSINLNVHTFVDQIELVPNATRVEEFVCTNSGRASQEITKPRGKIKPLYTRAVGYVDTKRLYNSFSACLFVYDCYGGLTRANGAR